MNQQLVLCRQLFDQARMSPAAETPYVRMIRIHHLDLCVEAAMNIVVHDHGTPEEQGKHGSRRPLGWHELWNLSDAISTRVTGKSLPGRAALKTMHETRNLAHHSGVVPAMEEINRCVEPTRAFLDFVCRDFYGVEFERLQEWHALQCSALRVWMDTCYEALEKDANVLAVAGTRVAFDKMVEAVRNEAAGDLLHLRGSLPDVPSQLRDALNALEDAFTMMESGIIAVGLGLSFADHYRYMRICRSLYPNPIMASRFSLLDRPEAIRIKAIPDEFADFAVQYIGKATTVLESAYPGVFDTLSFPCELRQSRLWDYYLGTEQG